MIISLCIVDMNRTGDLKQTLPATIRAANASPPVEIVILDYDSKDDLATYIESVKTSAHLNEGVVLNYSKSPNHKYFSISHSRNLAVMASHGDYIVILDADIIPHENYIKVLRETIEREKPVWMVEGGRYITGKLIGGRMLVCQKAEFIAAGGYDERFNLCGPEDKDICMRMHRRGGKFIAFDRALVDEIRTRARQKIENLPKEPYEEMLTEEQRIHNKPGWTKYLMQRAMRNIYDENNAKGVLVVNEGRAWGK